jgi:uncharacterized protein (DUF433 family)
LAKQIGERISIDPKVRSGKPVIKGTRVDVELVIGQIAGGMSIAAVADEYGLSKEDVKATLMYAAHLLSPRRVRE